MANQDQLRDEQLSITKLLETYDKSMSDPGLNMSCHKLQMAQQPALATFEHEQIQDGVPSEVTTAALMKSIDGLMFDIVTGYSPQAQDRIYAKMIDVLASRKAAIQRHIIHDNLLSRHILKLCLSKDFQHFLDEDLRGFGSVLSCQDAMRQVCIYCEVSTIFELDKYGTAVKCWDAIEHIFLGWLDRKNGNLDQELKQA